MNSSFINEYKPTIILTLALAVFLASCKGATTTPGTTTPTKKWVVTTLAGSTLGDDDGTGTEAQFRLPFGVAVDSSGILYVADSRNHRIRKITPDKVVSTLAGIVENPPGKTTTAGFADGAGTAAQFDQPTGVAVDSDGILYVADRWNNRIRKIITSEEGVVTVSTLAGSRPQGSADGAGTAATFTYPTGVTVDSSGILYVADHNNNRIRKIIISKIATSDGVSTLAGSTEAQFFWPSGVAVDSSGNVYVADSGNHRIRKTTPAGKVTTIAGIVENPPGETTTAGFADGAGTEAQFSHPSGVAVDSSGILYVADFNNHRIRKITPAGVVTTIAGSGTAGKDDGTGTAAQFNTPHAVAVDSSGILYVADTWNNRIRKIEYK